MDEDPSVDDNAETVKSADGNGHVSSLENSNVEPDIGMEFESEEAARVFYARYATHLRFHIRVDKARYSEQDGKLIYRALGCNKQGFRRFRPGVMKPKPVTREGCKATVVWREKTDKWVVTKFIKEHCHPLVVTPTPAKTCQATLLSQIPISQMSDDKDLMIRELTAELHRERKRSAAIQRVLETVLTDVEEHSNYQREV
ncbi:OLC1v1032100C1 [Oldenlandia corymbosa var. corymbosa]|uniref:OLC1v1032100C1 n=1 Tax=Oldenlandia corymbosa var. corymbosa TaxID=529605 RepID=A0AAV1CJX4_OLDCO|nr:OLC1v1032100C1 [Oldenlandia corymbosa var. corymbosa]